MYTSYDVEKCQLHVWNHIHIRGRLQAVIGHTIQITFHCSCYTIMNDTKKIPNTYMVEMVSSQQG